MPEGSLEPLAARLVSSTYMTLSEVLTGLGRDRFNAILRGVSMGALKTYKVYEAFKVRTRLLKLNRDRLRKAAPRLWDRLVEGDADLARELAQGALVSNLEMIIQVLDFLEIPHDGNGFFDQDDDAKKQLAEGWQARVIEEFGERYPEPLLLLYVNHLDWEMNEPDQVYLGT